jgi:heptose I phosphotransferase
MKAGTFWSRLVRGSRWTWCADEYRALLPAELESSVMTLPAHDRHHAKQGRSTGRLRFDTPAGTLSVYIKRHYQLAWPERLGALLNPAGLHSPAAAEWARLGQARALGIRVPDPVAAGERIGPWGSLQSFLMVAELEGCQALNEVLPTLAESLEPKAFAKLKRQLAEEIAEITARLHRARLFHKDLYLCHFFLDLRPGALPGERLSLIDLHRLGRHPIMAPRWRIKDLGELLFSTFAVPQIQPRDRLRFWMHYHKKMAMRGARWQLLIIWLKATLYRRHNLQHTSLTPIITAQGPPSFTGKV